MVRLTLLLLFIFHQQSSISVVCGIDQFASQTKYDSGSGWPSFFDVIDKANISKRKDASGGESNIAQGLEMLLFID